MNISLDALILKNRYLVDKVLSKYKEVVHPVNLEEMEVDGLIGLWRAICLYDPNKQKSFKNYASQKIRYAIKDGLRERDRLARSQRNNDDESIEIISIDDVEEECPSVVYTDTGINHFECQDFVEVLLKQIDQQLVELLYMRFWLGLTNIQIAKKKQLNRKRIARDIQRALDELKGITIHTEAYQCLK